MKLTGISKCEKTISWFKVHNAINKIRLQPFFNGFFHKPGLPEEVAPHV